MNCILISPKIILSKHKTISHVIEDSWFKYLSKKKVKLLPVNVKSFQKKDLAELKPKAVILSGGNDLPIITKNKANIIREKNDNFLFKYAQSKRIPLLAICHGFHFVAKKFGAKIIRIKGHVKKNHEIKLDNFIKKKIITLRVNSYHNYGIYDLPKKFSFISKCSDGTIEFAEIKKKKILCLMFHPERKNLSQNKINKIVFNHLKIS